MTLGRHSMWVVVIVLAAVIVAADDKGGGSSQSKKSSPEQASTQAAAAKQTVPNDYKIGPGDVLAIHIWKEPDLSRTLPVRPDGKISLPLVGEVAANDTTAGQLQAKLTTEYKNYLNTPEITVIVQEAHSQRFNVVGQVQRPGSFVLTQPTTVLDAVALVGGFRDFAKTKKIYVLRTNADGTTQRFPFDYNKVVKGQSFEQNIHLQAGDTVVVP